MKNFDNILNEELDTLSLGGEVQGKLELIKELTRELESAKERVAELEMNLRHSMEEYNVELAKALRKRIPQVGINLSNGRCSASYKSTNLSCRPDINSNSWVFDDNQHGRRFSRRKVFPCLLSYTTSRRLRRQRKNIDTCWL